MSFIDWNSLKNPIFSHKNWSVKDACFTYHKDEFFIFFSAFMRDKLRIHCHLVEIKTEDWKMFSKPIFHYTGKKEGWTGLCSPNISKINEEYILTFNSWGTHHKNGRTNNLFYIKSKDLMNWSGKKQIAKNLTENIRTIDIAIAYENNKYYAVWKDRDKSRKNRWDRARIAVSKSLDDDFEYIEDGYMKFYLKSDSESKLTHENFEFIKIDGIWYLLTTDYRPHRPFLYQINGDGSGKSDSDWLIWKNGYELEVKEEVFNTNHLSNAAYLADFRNYDGFFYLIYAGNTESIKYARRGYNQLGLSRSKTLKNFNAPKKS